MTSPYSEPDILPPDPWTPDSTTSPYGEEAPRGLLSKAAEMTTHLEELRNRILWSVGSILGAMALVFSFAHEIIHGFQILVPSEEIQFIQLTPGEVLIVSFQVALLGGLVLSTPVWLYHTMRFVFPGLTGKEQRLFIGVLLGGTVLFALGCAFAYFMVLPNTLQFLWIYGADVAKMTISIAHYVRFCAGFMVLTGVMFELPLLLILLSSLGLVPASILAKKWREVIVAISIITAVATPSQDPMTMMMVAGCLTGLYLITLWPLLIMEKQKKKRQKMG